MPRAAVSRCITYAQPSARMIEGRIAVVRVSGVSRAAIAPSSTTVPLPLVTSGIHTACSERKMAKRSSAISPIVMGTKKSSSERVVSLAFRRKTGTPETQACAPSRADSIPAKIAG